MLEFVSYYEKNGLETIIFTEKLWHSIITDKEDILCLFSLGLYTGLRIGDCACLKWNNVDLFRRIISIVPQKTKKYMGQIDIPIHNSLFNILSVLQLKKGDNNIKIFMSKTFSHL